MPHERFFIDSLLEEKQLASLDEAESHHLTRVMRARVGDLVELVNGRNQLATATVHQINKKTVQLLIDTVTTVSPALKQTILAQAIPRLPRLEYILEKATELGATEIHLFPGQYSEKTDFTPHQHQRMLQVIISALKQSGRLDLPLIRHLPPLLQWKPQAGTLFFGDPTATTSFISSQHPHHLTIVIGPERGFSLQEYSHLTAVLNALPVKLHPNTLRVDTAAIAALAQIQDFNSQALIT